MSPAQEKKETVKIMKKIIAALAVLLGLVSCQVEKDLSIIVQEMMSVQSGLLVNDLGVKYSIKDQSMASKILAKERVFLSGTAVPSETSGYDYLLTPYDWYEVIIKDCVKRSTVEDVDETLGTSPAGISHAWTEGNYVNLLASISYDATADDDDWGCEINLMFDDERSDSRNLYFVLKNKQTGLTWEDEELDLSEVGFAYQYLSFPYTQYLEPGFKGELTFHLEWEWFDPSPYTGEVPYRTVSAKQGNYTISIP